MALRFAIPSKGNLHDATLAFLERCGLRVSRPNPRRYTARMRALPAAEVLLHRPADIVAKVAAGEIDLGVTGLDLVEELRADREDLLVLDNDLGFGRCELVVAVPDTWIDVSSWYDLADLAVELHALGRSLRIATKYPALVRRFCYANGINYFRLVESQGATEAAPGLGYADVIADITETGSTIRDNQLKIVGEPILRSQASLIGNRLALRSNPANLAAAKTILELIEAERRGRSYLQIAANIPGASAAEVGRRVAARPELAGMQGPTVAPVWAGQHEMEGWYTVTIVIPREHMLATIAHLREMGGDAIAVVPLHYLFEARSAACDRLLALLAPAQ